MRDDAGGVEGLRAAKIVKNYAEEHRGLRFEVGQ